MKITVLGGGNGAHLMAADLTLKGHTVNMFEMPKFRDQIKELLESKKIRILRNGKEETAELHMVTTNIEEALVDVDWIFIVVPAFAHKSYAELLAPQLKSQNRIAFFPGTFGSLEFLRVVRMLNKKSQLVLAETDTLPWLCRLTEKAEIKVFHTITKLGVGVYPASMTAEVLKTLTKIFPLVPRKNVLECGLNSLNPVLHVPGVILNAGRIEYSQGEFYLYEEGYTPAVAHVVEALDKERVRVAGAFGFDLPSVTEILYATGYGPKGSFYESIRGSFLRPVRSPGSLQSRYLSEDIAYGLVTWSQLGDVVGVETQVTDALVTLASKLTGIDNWVEGRTLERLGIAGLNRDEILKKVEG